MKHLLKLVLVAVCVALAMQSCEDPVVDEILFRTSPSKFVVGQDGGKLILNISSPVAWTVSSDSRWIGLGSTTGESGVACQVTLTIPANTTESARTGTLTVTTSKKSEARVTLTQNGKNNSPSSKINDWILTTLKKDYLWNTAIAGVPNPDKSLDYQDFLYELVLDADGHDADGTDDGYTYQDMRYTFSWVDEMDSASRATTLDEFHQPTFGFDMAAWWVGQSKIACFVTWVREDSPAYKAGLRRGMWIDKYNGKAITSESQYGTFFTAWSEAAEGSTQNIGTLNGLSATITAEVMELTPLIVPPKVIELAGGKKVGYLFYNEFLDGPPEGTDGRPLFDNKLREAFGTTLAGVDELVVDLRYNTGGYVSSCEVLCALISGADSPEVFAKQAFNNRDSETNPSDNLCLIIKYAKEATALANLSRVFVLETYTSASASEMVISSLRGIRGDDWVVHIGDVTRGKNVGMNQFTTTIDNVKYEMWPITFKVHNAKGFAGYAAGFTPNYEVKDSNPEWYIDGERGYELGDPSEPLLKRALDIIGGTQSRAAGSYVQIDNSKLIPHPENPRRGGLRVRSAE